jgi:hypothetical protein
MKNLVKVTIVDQEVAFQPVDVKLEFTVRSQGELENLRDEFEEGEFADFTTSHSLLLFDILTAIKKLSK